MITCQSRSGFKIFAATLCLLACACVAAAQATRPSDHSSSTHGEPDQTDLSSVRGRVLTPEGSPFNGTARLTLQAMNGGQVVIFTDYQGQYRFDDVQPGVYTLEVDADRQTFVPATQSVQVYKGAPSVVNISLKYKESAAHKEMSNGASVISVAELDKSIPEKARKEFTRGSQAAQAGKTEEAITHFRKALEIYPDFMMAHNDLGVQLMAAKRLDEAAEQLRLAAQLDPKAFNPQLNLGIVLVEQHQFAEATVTLEKAITLNQQSPAARLYAGEAYAALGDADHAEKNLRSAFTLGGADYAAALFQLGNLYMSRGEREKAIQSFEAYLAAAPDAANAADARRLIGVLR
jgi:tetratricopeptide (TPR) repeat protein